MKRSALCQIAEALLYEGYSVYPYGLSARTNRRGSCFGRIFPQEYSDAQNGAEPFMLQTECLAQCSGKTPTVEVSVRFLHLMAREVHTLSPPPPELVGREAHRFGLVPELQVKGKLYQTCQEAVERKVILPPVLLEQGQRSREDLRFCFSAGHIFEPIREEDKPAMGAVNRRLEAIQGVVEVAAEPVAEKLFKLTVRILNLTPVTKAELIDQQAVLMRTFAAAHTVLEVCNGEFVSMVNPPAAFRAAVATCKNSGPWPVLVGEAEKAERTVMLSSPITLPDFPRISVESQAIPAHGTGMDQMLSMRGEA